MYCICHEVIRVGVFKYLMMARKFAGLGRVIFKLVTDIAVCVCM